MSTVLERATLYERWLMANNPSHDLALLSLLVTIGKSID
jgi:hypothetical protein